VIWSCGVVRRAVVTLAAAVLAACVVSPALAAARSSQTAGSGLWLVTATGRIVALGGAPSLSAPVAWTRQHVVVAAAGTPSGNGLWLLAVDGSVQPVGDASSFGPVPVPTSAARRAVGIAATPDGGGYLVAYADGKVAAAGDAVARGNASPPAGVLHGIAAIAITPTGNGYWLVGTDGHVYPFGDAPALGQPPARLLDVATAVATTPTGRGLWIGFADGHVATLGDAAALARTGRALVGPLSALAPTASGAGLWLAGLAGSVEARGDAAAVAQSGIVLPVVAAVASAPTGTLTVNVSELPAGASGAVTVAGGGTQFELHTTDTLRLSPGDYDVTADTVRVGTTTYRANVTGSPASIPAGGDVAATADYVWMIPDTTKDIPAGAVETASGDPTTGLTLTLDAATAPSLAVGNVVVIGFTDATPNGWIGKVASLSASGGALIASTVPASVEDAFPRGQIDVDFGSDGGTTVDGSAVRRTQAHADDSQDETFAERFLESLTCGGTANVSGGITVTRDIHLQASWSILHASFSAGLHAFVETQAHARFDASAAAGCTLAPTPFAELPPIRVQAGEVPLVLMFGLDVSAGIDAHAAVSAGATATELMSLNDTWSTSDGHHFDNDIRPPQFVAAPAPTLDADAEAWVKVGPRATLLIGGVAGPYVDVDAGLKLGASTAATPWWTLDGTLDADIGLSFLGIFDVAQIDPWHEDFPLLQASGPPPDNGGDGGGTGGGGTGGGDGNPPPTPATCDASGAPFPLMPGDDVPVEGHDFQPNETVDLALDDASGRSLGTATTDADGNFSTTVTLPADATASDAAIVGTVAGGGDRCSAPIDVYTGPPPGWSQSGSDAGSYASTLASEPRTVDQLTPASPSWPHLSSNVLPGDVVFAVTTRGGSLGTVVDTEGPTIVSYAVVTGDGSGIDLGGLGPSAVVTVVRNIDPNDPVAGHTVGAARSAPPLFYTTPFYYTFDDAADCPYGVGPPCTISADPKVIGDDLWATPPVDVTAGQGLLGFEAIENDSQALAYATCGSLPVVSCPYPAQGNYSGWLLLGDTASSSGTGSSDPTGVDETVAGPNGEPAGDSATAKGYIDSAILCNPHGSYPVELGIQVAQDSLAPCQAWADSPLSLGLLVLNPRPGPSTDDDVPPTTPLGITVDVEATSVTLNWEPSIDNTGVVGYAIFRDGTWIATVTGTSYTDTRVDPFSSHHYAVVAIDGFGNSSGGATEDVVTQVTGGGGGGGTPGA